MKNCEIWNIKVPNVEETRNGKLFISNFMAHNENSESWNIYLGRSTHMTSQEDFLTQINDNYSSKVIFGDDRLYEVKGKGIVVIPTLQGKKKFVEDTLLTPTLKKKTTSCRIDDGTKLQVSV